jgi:sugar lactone lactonase YvrE
VGLAFYGGDLYVANHGNNTIEVFNSAGHGSVFASTGLSGPVGLAFDTNGNLYVANAFNNTIEKFNSSGSGTAFATVGSSDNVLEGLAFDTNGNLYASSIGLTIEPPSVTAIVKITPDGAESDFGSGSGLNDPEGLAFDSSGNLYVANSGNSTLEKFTTSGSGSIFASSGLYSPVDIATQAVPEPATWTLVALGTAALIGRRRSTLDS